MDVKEKLRLPVQFIFAVAVHLLWIVPGKVVAPLMVAIGIWTDWKSPLTWPWDNNKEADGITIWNWWYSRPNNPQHGRVSLFFWNRGGFWREWYWRVRNGFSNGARYTFRNPSFGASDEVVVVTGNKRISGDGWYFQYNLEQWWYARFRYSKRDEGSDRGWTYYVGWKLDRTEGFGLTHRLPKKSFIPDEQDYSL